MSHIDPQETGPGSEAVVDAGEAAPALGLAYVPTVILSPSRAFAALAARPGRAWLGPMILIALLAALSAWIMAPVSVEVSYDMAVATMERLGVPEEQQAQALADIPTEVTPGQILQQTASSAAFTAIFLVVAGALVHFVTRMFGARTTFSRSLGLVALSHVILAIGNLVNALLVASAGTLDVTLGPGALLPDLDLYSPLGLILDAFNVFAIWFLFVLVAGLRGVTGVAGGTAWGIGVTYWVIRALFVTIPRVFIAWSRGG